MKITFDLKTFQDEHFTRKLKVMSVIEAAFDDARNELPEEWYNFTEVELFPLGKTMKITLEVVDE